MQVQKAWDRKSLLADLEAIGIKLAEPTLEKLLDSVTDWTSQSLVLQGGLAAAVALPVLAMCKPLIKSQIDKIDPNDGDGK